MLVRCWEHSKPAFCGTSSWSHSEWKIKNPWQLTWHRVANHSRVTDSRDKRELIITQRRRVFNKNRFGSKDQLQEGELFFVQLGAAWSTVPEHPQISGLATLSKGADIFCLGWWVLRTTPISGNFICLSRTRKTRGFLSSLHSSLKERDFQMRSSPFSVWPSKWSYSWGLWPFQQARGNLDRKSKLWINCGKSRVVTTRGNGQIARIWDSWTLFIDVFLRSLQVGFPWPKKVFLTFY